jgi:hypothetical protein
MTLAAAIQTYPAPYDESLRLRSVGVPVTTLDGYAINPCSWTINDANPYQRWACHTRAGKNGFRLGQALRELVAAGKVVASGKPPRLRYAVKRGHTSGTAGASDTTAKRRPAGSPSKKTSKSAGKPKAQPVAPPLASQADYDAAVLSTIRGADERLTSTAIQARVGGSIDQVRAALHRLVASGQVVRAGERKLTRYGAAGQS